MNKKEGTRVHIDRQEVLHRLESLARDAELLGSPGLRLRWLYTRVIELSLRSLRRRWIVKTPTFWGGSLYVILPELVSLFIRRYGFWEYDLSCALVKIVQPGMTFVDVGAHIGYYTMLGSWLVGAEGRVYAFEASREMYRILCLNAKLASNVSVFNLAVWSHSSEITLQDFGTRYAGYNTVRSCRHPRARRVKVVAEYSVQTISLDEFFHTKGIRPDVVKIDVENSELEVLRGMQKCIQKWRPFIALELGDINGEEGRSTEIIGLLSNYGYTAWEWRGAGFVPHEEKDLDYSVWFGNVVFMPQERYI